MGTTTGRSGSSWSTVALTVVIVALLGLGAWWGWQAYPQWFGQSVRDAPAVAEQTASVERFGEAPQDVGTGKIETSLPGAEDTPPPDKAEVEQPISKEPTLSPEEADVARLLAAAEADLKARRLTSPTGNNAWDRYQQVLEIDPANLDAIKGMERVIDSYMELFGAEVEKEDFDKAAGYLAKIGELHPDSLVLEEGEQRLKDAKQERVDRLAEQERQRQAELERQRIAQAIDTHWTAFETAIQAEDLDEAVNILKQVRDLNPEAPGLTAGEQRLEAAQVELERKRQEALKLELAGEMVSIPGGTFRMGDLSGEGDDDEKPVNSVTVPAFSMGKHEVTVGRFRRFVEETEYRTDAERNAEGKEGCLIYTKDGWGWTWGRSWRNPGYAVGDDQPLACVSWNDAQAFIAWVTEKTGEAFRLPTEAEWEYAVRAGSTTKYHFGNSDAQLCRYANHADDSTDYSDRNKSCSDGVDERSATVGRYQPNSYGLYDMHGNAWELVEDCWNENYQGAPSDGSAWTSGDCSQRVVRGGSWGATPKYLRSSSRLRNPNTFRSAGLGFRLAQYK